MYRQIPSFFPSNPISCNRASRQRLLTSTSFLFRPHYHLTIRARGLHRHLHHP
jgi:hypothetical protein